MKIAIASDDEKNISAHFGRTKGFIIYDIEDYSVKNKEYRINDFTFHTRGLVDASHTMDRHAGIVKALNDCQAIISNGMGRRIYDDLQSANIDAFIVHETDAEEASKWYLKNEIVNNPEKGCEHKKYG